MLLKNFLLLALALSVISSTFGASPIESAIALRSSKQYERAMQAFEKLANGGDAVAQRHLGEMILQGEGVTAAPSVAFEWMQHAAKARDPIGQYNLAYMYENGLGVNKSIEHALIWYERSGNNGYAVACRRLGEIYQDNAPSASFYWYDKARMAGDDSLVPTLEQVAMRLNSESRERIENSRKQWEDKLAENRKRHAQSESNASRFAAQLQREFSALAVQQSSQADRINAASRGTTVETDRRRQEGASSLANRPEHAANQPSQRAASGGKHKTSSPASAASDMSPVSSTRTTSNAVISRTDEKSKSSDTTTSPTPVSHNLTLLTSNKVEDEDSAALRTKQQREGERRDSAAKNKERLEYAEREKKRIAATEKFEATERVWCLAEVAAKRYPCGCVKYAPTGITVCAR